MVKKKSNRKEKGREYERLVEEETLIFEATEMIAELLESEDVSRKELADRLDRSKGFVTQILSGDRNMTLRTLADFAFAFERRVKLAATPLVESGDGGEAMSGPGRAMARVYAGVGDLPAPHHKVDESPRRPVAVEGGSLAKSSLGYARFSNARAEGDWGEDLLWADTTIKASGGAERIAGEG